MEQNLPTQAPLRAVHSADMAMTRTDTITQSDDLLALIAQTLDKEKAEDIVTIPLKGKTSMADYMVVASGRSGRQVAALAEKLVEVVKASGDFLPKVEGKEAADWVLIDAGDVIAHIFRPEVREFYQIEKMWQSEVKSGA